MVEDGTSSVGRAVAILMALGSPEATQQGALGVVEVARMVGREKSQVSRALKVLQENGLVERDPATSGYRLGWRLVTLAKSAGDQRLLGAAPPVLRRLVASVGEGAHLSVLEGDAVLTVQSEKPMHAVQAAGWVGRSVPVWCTSAGRALLFDHSDDEIRELLTAADFTPGGPKAPSNVDQLLPRIRRARARQYALVDEEFAPGLVAAAAPVRDFHGRVVAAVDVSAPKFRVGRQLDSLGRRVHAAGAQLTDMVGDTG